VNPFAEPVELLDANGQPTGIKLVREVHTPNPEIEIDQFPLSIGLLTVVLPNGQTETINVHGPTRVEVNIPPNGLAVDTDGDGLDQVPSVMTDMELRGKSSVGDIVVRLAGPAHGQIQEVENNTRGKLDIPPFTKTGTARSFFDIPAEFLIGGNVYHTAKPLHMETIIEHKPPRPGDRYVNPFTDPIDILDSAGRPTGFKLVKEIHIPTGRPVITPRQDPVDPAHILLDVRLPAKDTGAVLQQSTSVTGGFQDVTTGIIEQNGEQILTVDPKTGGPFRFYRFILIGL
jgi:hypothetical protein